MQDPFRSGQAVAPPPALRPTLPLSRHVQHARGGASLWLGLAAITAVIALAWRGFGALNA